MEQDLLHQDGLPELDTAHVPTVMSDVAEDEEPEVELDEEVGFIRYNRAFVAKMSMTADNLKAYYNVLKNTLLSYKGVKSRLSWCYDSYNKGRNPIAKINVRGNGLIVYLALDPHRYEGTKYRFRDVSFKKKYADVPMQIKIRSKRGLRYAVELVADIMADLGIKQGEVGSKEYAPARESLEELMARNLVRIVHSHTEEEAEVAAADTAEEIKVEDANASNEENLCHSECSVSEIEEPEPEVSVVEADVEMSDSEALSALETGVARRAKGKKKAVVNIDVISRAFKPGETVDLASLIARRVVPQGTYWFKVCARGSLDKPLTVCANDFSVIAIKMIVLCGGHAVKLK